MLVVYLVYSICFTGIAFTMLLSRQSSLEGLLSQELSKSQVSAQGNTSVVATKGQLKSKINYRTDNQVTDINNISIYVASKYTDI